MNKSFISKVSLFILLALCGCNKGKQQSNNNETNKKTEATENKATEIKGNSSAQIYAKPEIPVLCYHRISEGNKGDYTVSPATFEAHMKILADSGYHSILPDQLYDYLVFDKTLPEKPVVITFDDSRVEHSTIAAPVMEKYGFRGTFFIMTITYNKKNYMTTDQIALLKKAGHTIGLHSWDHTMAVKYKEPEDWQKQVIDPKKKLEGIIANAVEYWAYPNGVFNHESALELSKHFKLSFSLASKRDSIIPLQTVRRMIVPDWTAQGMLKSMHRTFNK